MHAGVILTCLLLSHVFAHLVTTETRLDTRRSLVFLVFHLKIGAKYQLCEFSFILNYSAKKSIFSLYKDRKCSKQEKKCVHGFFLEKIKY